MYYSEEHSDSDEDNDTLCDICDYDMSDDSGDSDTVTVNLRLKSVDAEGEYVSCYLSAELNNSSLSITNDGDSAASTLNIGTNTLSCFESSQNEVYRAPDTVITFTADADGNINVTSGNATVETVGEITYIVITMQVCEHSFDDDFWSSSEIEGYHEQKCDFCAYMDSDTAEPHIDEDLYDTCDKCSHDLTEKVTVNLMLKAVDAVTGNEIDGMLEVYLNDEGNWFGTEECGYGSVFEVYMGENVLSDWDYCPEGYVLPTEDITFTVDAEGNITITSGNATVEETPAYIDIVIPLIADNNYTITVENTENGTVSAPATAAAGEPVTLTITRADGYYIDFILINHIPDKTAIGKTEITFTMPEEDVTITPNFKEGFVIYFDNDIIPKWSNVFCFYSGGYASGIDIGENIYAIGIYAEHIGNPMQLTNRMEGMTTNHYPEGYFESEWFILEAGETYTYTGYDITVEESENGTVTVKTGTLPITKASVGQEVTVEIAPDDGYELDTLPVGGEDVTAQVSEGAYTFDMPASDVTVTAIFKAADPEVY